jgi:hypothetical protein
MGCIMRILLRRVMKRTRNGPANGSGHLLDHPSRPKPGDLLIRNELGAGRPFSLATFPDSAQLSCRSGEDALQIATGFARCHEVDIWHEKQGVYTRLKPGDAVPSASTLSPPRFKQKTA